MDKVDPIPQEVTDFARAALGWRRLDADLAELAEDSAIGTDLRAGVRGESERRLTFHGGELTIDLEIHARQGSIRLLGQIAPPSTAATVEVQTSDGTFVASTNTDTLGRFKVELTVPGRLRLRVTLAGAGSRPIETSWFTP
jgi:hypothetical protein